MKYFILIRKMFIKSKIYTFQFPGVIFHHILKSPERKYDMDRSDFTNYLNLKYMYNHTEDMLINDAKVTTKLEQGWDYCRNEKEFYGIKVSLEEKICVWY